MKRKANCILTLTIAGGFTAATTLLGEPSQAELLKQAKVTKHEAAKIALAKAPGGKIESAEIENEHHALVWSFDIALPGRKNITEVLVDAKTGKVLDQSTENPAAQAKEAAADKANGGK